MAFGVHSGNDNLVSWGISNTLFAATCPCVLIVDEGHTYSKFVFELDRDKGCNKSLMETFPRNLATSCVHHIKANVKTRLRLKAMYFVFPIAKSFSTVVEEALWSMLQVQPSRAFEYLGMILITQW